MKFTDALARTLKSCNINHVFGLQGGAVVHIFDSLEQLAVGVTYTHHEQSAALAAVAYAKATGNVGCAVVTSGPGCTNAITGLLAAWQDSIPCIFLSGQVRSQHTSYGRKVRQVGTQEVNIIDIIRPITKYCKFIENKDQFIDELEYALKISMTGRPGPVWLDIPLDLQWSDIPFSSEHNLSLTPIENDNLYDQLHQLNQSLKILNEAERPLLVLGYGLRLANCSQYLSKIIDQHSLPFVTTWTGADLFATNHPLNLGIIGMCGQRGANKAIFAADTLICLGTHLSIPHTTTLFDSYAPNAKKIIINIDKNQLDNLNVNFDLKINSDLTVYLKWLSAQDLKTFKWPDLKKIKEANWYIPKIGEKPNSNIFVHKLTAALNGRTCLVVDGGGTALYAGFQSSVLKKGDRIICSSSISSMGTGLAESIGASKCGGFDKLLCVIGDGSFLMNVQDLQTIHQDKINVIISVINNNGYLAIRHTQKDFLGGRFYGTHPEWNLEMPSIHKIAAAFDIPYLLLDKAAEMDVAISKLIKTSGPIICEVVIDENQDVLFKQGYQANPDGTFSPQPLSEMQIGLIEQTTE